MSIYSQGICEDGEAILKDGKMMTVEEIVSELNMINELVDSLRDCADCLDLKNGYEPYDTAEELITKYYDGAAAIPEGYALVPIKPTSKMLEAAQLADGDHGDHEDWLGFKWEMGMDQVWAAMLEAAEEVNHG